MKLKLLRSIALSLTLSLLFFSTNAQLHFETLVYDGLGQPLLSAPSGVGVSPDGNHIYVVSYDANAINTYTRDASGELVFVGSLVTDINGVSGMAGAFDVMVSPEGNHVYVAGSLDNSVAVFSRDSNTGELTFVEKQTSGMNNVLGLSGANSLVMSPDGNFLYVTGSDENSVAVFARNVVSGKLTFIQVLQDENGDVVDMNYPVAVTMSPDGANVYVTAYGDNAITVFSRDMVSGMLTFQSVVNNVPNVFGAYSIKISPDGTSAYCAWIDSGTITLFDRNNNGDLTFNANYQDDMNGVDGLFGVNALSISMDGNFVFATGGYENAMAVFSRANDGTLSYQTKFEEGVNGVSGMTYPFKAVLSPDEKSIYVPAFGANEFAVFEMDNAGMVSFDHAEKPGNLGVDGLGGASAMAMSPTGNHIYVTGETDNAISIFQRDPNTGLMEYIGMMEDGMNGIAGLQGANSVVVSPNGNFVYASGFWDNSIAIFARDQVTGMLSFMASIQEGANGVEGIYGVNNLAMSEDGMNLYATGFWNGTLAVFSCDPMSGTLTFMESFRDGVDGVDGLNRSNSVEISPDGMNAYITGSSDDALAVFSRDASTGALTYMDNYKNGVNGITDMDAPFSSVVSPDGAYVYVVSNRSDALVVFSRNTMDGSLMQVESHVNGMAGVVGLDGASSVAVSTDGLFVYTVSNGDNSATVFRKNVNTGALSFEKSQQDGMAGVNGIGFGSDVKVSESGRHIYVSGSGDNAVALFSCTYLVTLQEQICEGDSVVVGSSVYKSSGVYQDTFDIGSCNNIITLDLEVQPSMIEMKATICEGDSYDFGGTEYTDAGVYTEDYTSMIGCDSTVQLTLEVVDSFEPQMVQAEICQGEFFVMGNEAYHTTGTYTQINLTDFGCEETTVLELEVMPSYDVQISEVICEGEFFVFGTSNYTMSGVYTETMTSMTGCDSIVTLNLNVIPADGSTQTMAETICSGESFLFGGQEYTETGIYTQTMNGANCSAEVVLDLTVLPAPPAMTMEAVICEGETYSFDGQMLSASGTYTSVSSSMNGCDSMTVLELVVEPTNSHKVVSVCFGETYQFGNQELDATGDYSYTETSMNNCMTTFTINFTVLDQIEENAEITGDNGQGNGQINPNISGGMAPYLYTWSNGKTTPSISNLDAGTYNLLVTDSNGCTMNFSFVVDLTSSVRNLSDLFEVNIFPNPATVGEEVSLMIDTKSQDRVQIAIFDISGRRLQHFPLTLAAGENLNNFNAPKAAGIYVLRMINEEGREQSFRFSVK